MFKAKKGGRSRLAKSKKNANELKLDQVIASYLKHLVKKWKVSAQIGTVAYFLTWFLEMCFENYLDSLGFAINGTLEGSTGSQF